MFRGVRRIRPMLSMAVLQASLRRISMAISVSGSSVSFMCPFLP